MRALMSTAAAVVALAGLTSGAAWGAQVGQGERVNSAADAAQVALRDKGTGAGEKDRGDEGREWESRIAEMRAWRKSGVLTARLSNGVTVHVRRMTLAPMNGAGSDGASEQGSTDGEAAITVAINGAELLETDANRGVSMLSVGILDSDDNADIGPGRPKTDVDSALLQDAFLVRVRGDADELESGLRWLAYALEHPRLETSTLDRRRTDAESYLASGRMKRPTAVSEAVIGVLHAETDVRLHAPSTTQLSRIDASIATEWVRRHAAEAPIEVSVVGSIPIEEALRVVALTLGDLPVRGAPSPVAYAERRELRRATPPMVLERDDAIAGQIGGVPASVVMVGFAGCEIGETTEHRTLRAVAAILNLRVGAKLNQVGVLPEQPATFVGRPALAYPTMGVVAASCRVEADQAEATRGALMAAIDDLIEHPTTLEELASATAPLAQAAGEFDSDAPAWSTILARSQMRAVNPDGLVGGAAFYRALTPSDLSRAMARYAAPEHRFSITLRTPDGVGGVRDDAAMSHGDMPSAGTLKPSGTRGE